MPSAAHTHAFAPAAASLRRSRLAWESTVRVLPGHWYAQTARRISCFSWTRVGSRARCTSSANSRGRSSTGTPAKVAVQASVSTVSRPCDSTAAPLMRLCRAIITEQPDLRDRLCLCLLLDYGLRKGALQAVQFKHFDHRRKRLTIFTKGQKVRELPLPHRAFWHDLEHHILDISAQPSHYLLCTQRTIPRVGVRRYPEKPMSGHAAHDW